MVVQDDNYDPEDPGSGPPKSEGPWTNRVAYSENGGGYAYRPREFIVIGPQSVTDVASLVSPFIGEVEATYPIREGGHEWLVRAATDVDVPAQVEELRDAGHDVEPNYVLFTHAMMGTGCDCCCGGGLHGNPVYANPVYANPVYANPVYANPVYANPVYASPVYANPVYANPVYANQYQTSGVRATSARPAAPPNLSELSIPDGPQKLFILDTGIAPRDQLPPLLQLPNYQNAPVSAQDPPDPGADGYLDPANGHGTFIAGIIELLAPGRNAHVLGPISSFGDGDIAHISALLRRLAHSGALDENTVINLSFGGYADREMRLLARAVRDVQRQGAVVVASAGNDGSCRHTYPACLSNVVSVGSIESHGPAPYSNYGSWVRCCAPGTDVVSAFYRVFNGDMPVPPVPGSGDPDCFEEWARWTGTSFSAPIVAAALLRYMSVTGETAAQAVSHIVDAAALYRFPGLGTVVNMTTPLSA